MRLLAKWANPKTHCSDDILSKENVKCVVRKVLSYGKKSFKSSTLHLPTYVRISNYKKNEIIFRLCHAIFLNPHATFEIHRYI